MTKRKTMKPVLLSANNALFYGRTAMSPEELCKAEAITLEGCRWVAYWKHPDNWAGLAAEGPRAGSRVLSPVTLTVRGPAQHVVQVSADGAKAWDAYGS